MQLYLQCQLGLAPKNTSTFSGTILKTIFSINSNYTQIYTVYLKHIAKPYLKTKIFAYRKKNIGQDTLIELSDEDLIKLGVDEENVRERLIKEIKNLPIYEERNQR